MIKKILFLVTVSAPLFSVIDTFSQFDAKDILTRETEKGTEISLGDDETSNFCAKLLIKTTQTKESIFDYRYASKSISCEKTYTTDDLDTLSNNVQKQEDEVLIALYNHYKKNSGTNNDQKPKKGFNLCLVQ